jgi:hypothetical protein
MNAAIFPWQADGVWIGTQCVRLFFWESAGRQALVGVEGRGAPVASISSGIRSSIYTFAVLQSTALPWGQKTNELGHEIRCWFGLGIRVG